MRLTMIFAFCLLGWTAIAQNSYGEIVGYLYENDQSESKALFAKVWVEDNGAKIGATTDADGKFRISAIPPGLYLLQAQYNGDTLTDTITCEVAANGILNLGRVNVISNVKDFDVVTIRGGEPLIKFGSAGETSISALDIKNSPDRQDPVSLIVGKNSDIKKNESGQMMIRGARPGDMAYFIDGVKLRDALSIPGSAIGGVTVYTSAIPAKYGDTNGGVIVMNTKSYSDLYRRWKIMTTIEN
ncbi:TonB-dependent Receptor Plug Domain [Lishizhenia tianjinensis]|uniref:TonB-dependent Receptor Plug Domain n=1 Tax=Lishizhenia tianjinensis TaxID=477690 RepID=A0A1I6ZYM7_9FLAO|nr:carboxypeptidase-like regulatory domain-containing protein [Lishizhenia tianjinensis]SFT67763.1 TonB-dependent Receptor Plug Domain [Lishizhenia tianjinensis]